MPWSHSESGVSVAPRDAGHGGGRGWGGETDVFAGRYDRTMYGP